MKKLMFSIALAGAAAAYGAIELENFEAADGVYNVTITQKYLEPTYSPIIEGEPIEASGETKKEAEKAANEEFAEIKADKEFYPKAKKTKTTTVRDGDEYLCTIEWTYESEDPEEWEITGAKTKSLTLNGLLVKGDFDGEFVEDGTFFIWPKMSENRSEKGKYSALPCDEAELLAQQIGKKSVATMSIFGVNGVGFGSADKNGVKNASGNAVFDAEEAEYVEDLSFGTWKIQKDASATKFAEKGYDLEQLLNKKGATEAQI